jgi:hypothetical protein
MLLEAGRPIHALREFRLALSAAPRRRGSLIGAAQAAKRSGDAEAAKQFRAQTSAGQVRARETQPLRSS